MNKNTVLAQTWRNARGRKVLYLDQCILSDLVKAEKGVLRAPNLSAAENLRREIDRAVFVNETAIVVESYIHQAESVSLGNGRITSDDIWEILTPLSRGLSLLPGSTVLQWQALLEAALLDGLVDDRFPPWRTGLSRDPDLSNSQTGVLGGNFVVAAGWRSDLDWVKIDPSQLEDMRKSGQLGSFKVELQRCQDAIARTAKEKHRLLHWETHWHSSSEWRPSHETVTRVLEERLFSLPFAKCLTQISASLLSEPDRKFSAGDLNDRTFAAGALPYCHMIMVDSNLGRRIAGLGLDQEYGTTVFGASLADYERAAEWLRVQAAG